MTTYQPPIILSSEELSPASGRKRRFMSYEQDTEDDSLHMVAKRRNLDSEYHDPGYILGNNGFEFKVDSDNNDIAENFWDNGVPSPPVRMDSATPGMSPSPGSKVMSDHIKDMCNCQCNICGKIFVHHRMLKHIERTHKLPAKDKFTFLRVTHYKCKLCTSEMLFSFYTIGQHARSRHQMTLQQYRDNVVGAFQGDLVLDQSIEDSSAADVGEKEVTDNLVNMCQVKCFVCHQKMYLNSLKRHLQKDHDDCDLDFPHKIEFLKRTYYKCKICDSLVLFHFDAINKHLSTVHNSTMHAYKNQFTAFTGDKEYKAVIKQADKEKARQNRMARQDAAAASPASVVAAAVPRTPVNPPRTKTRNKFVMEPEEMERWEVTLNNTIRYYSNNLDEVCVRRCRVCGEMMYADSLKSHIYQNHRGIQENTGSMDYVRLTYHKCKVCGKDLKFTVNSITKHTKRSHNVNFKEYSQQFDAFDKIPCDLSSCGGFVQDTKKAKKSSPKVNKTQLEPFVELSNKDNTAYHSQHQTMQYPTPQQSMSKENGFISNYRFRTPVPREFLVNNGVPFTNQTQMGQQVHQRPLQPQQQYNQQQMYVDQSGYLQQSPHYDYQVAGRGQPQAVLPNVGVQVLHGSHGGLNIPLEYSDHLGQRSSRPAAPVGGHSLAETVNTPIGVFMPNSNSNHSVAGEFMFQGVYTEPVVGASNGVPFNSQPQQQPLQPLLTQDSGLQQQQYGQMRQFSGCQLSDNGGDVAVKSEPSPRAQVVAGCQQQYPAAGFAVKPDISAPPLTASVSGFQPVAAVKSELSPSSSVTLNPVKQESGGSPPVDGFTTQQHFEINCSKGEVKPKAEPQQLYHQLTTVKQEPICDPLSVVATAGVSPLAGLDDEAWYDGNTVQCLQCGFISKSLEHFDFHVQDYHKKSPSDWSSVSRSNNMYTCQICRQQVYHEKSVISHHLATFHSLNLESYAVIYEQQAF